MAEGGLDARTWLTIVGVFVMFFGLPFLMLEYDRRKTLRQKASSAESATSALPSTGPGTGQDCARCGRAIATSDEIRRTAGGEWVHLVC